MGGSDRAAGASDAVGRSAEEVTPDTGIMTALRTGRVISGELFPHVRGERITFPS